MLTIEKIGGKPKWLQKVKNGTFQAITANGQKSKPCISLCVMLWTIEINMRKKREKERQNARPIRVECVLCSIALAKFIAGMATS